jgi:hypothetical protein
LPVLKPTEKDLGIRQIPFRIHVDDYALLRKMLFDDGMKFQFFVDACVQAYLRGDPAMLRFVKDWKMMSEIPREKKAMYMLSHRDRQALLDEFEKDLAEKGPKEE